MEDHIPLELRNVTFGYSSSPKPILKNINLTIHKGEFVGIVARTGSGKSTLLGIMAGVIPHHYRGELEGEVFLYGQETRTLSLSKFSVHVGLVMQDPDSQLFNLLVRDEVVWGLENRGVPRAEMRGRFDEVMDFFHIDHLKERITYDLSGGEKQRVVLSSVYVNNPSILLLDNPTSQLDPLGSEYVIQSIKQVLETHETVVMVEDKIDELLTHTDRLILLHEGEILLDAPPDEFVNHKDILERVGITPPSILDLSLRLQQSGVKIHSIPLTLEEALPLYTSLMNGTPKKESNQYHPAVTSPEPSPPTAQHDLAVGVHELNFFYPPPQVVQAIKNVSFGIERKSFVGIIGQNGSGKTTLARCIAGYLQPTEGEVIVGGRNVYHIDIYERARRVGYVFQNPETQLFRMSVFDEVMFTLQYQKITGTEAEERVREILEFLDLWDQAHLHPFRLSVGDKQRLAIACIAVLRPDALIIDEPTTGQDPAHAWAIMQLLEQLREHFGITVIVITHAMTLAANFCDRIIALRQGEVILDGAPRAVFAQSEMLAETHVKAPSITQLGLKLGINPPPLNVDEAEAMFRERLL
jgi:energy-coupling factor transport system ATP-binding protein